MKKGSMLIHLCRVIIGMLFLIAIYFVQISIAAEKTNLATKKTAPKKTQCWKRLPPLEKELMSPEYSTMCKAYEEVLNKTCEPPEKLQCNWTLPKGETRFKKLKWQSIDPKEHWELIQDMVLAGWNEKYRTGQWVRVEPEYKQDLAEGRLKMSVASVDIAQNGHLEIIALFNKRSCGDKGWKDLYGIMNPDNRRLNWHFENLLLNINARYGAEILIYKWKAYLFGWEPTPGEVMVYKGFSLFGGSSFGSINICRFEYLKGRK